MDIAKELLKIKNLKDLENLKRKISKELKIPCPSNIELLSIYRKTARKSPKLETLLRKRKIRSLSGVVVVSVLTKPYPCPGKCIFCPQEKGMPKSYLSGEPAAERAKKLKFDPYLQMTKRIESLEIQGHPTDKIEARIIGASFSSYPRAYKLWFLANLFAGANKTSKVNQQELENQQTINEKAKHRLVGISIETRPDLINQKEIDLMRKLGITMVELGIQTVFNSILKTCQRGHTIKDAVAATKMLKDAGFKVMYQMMPNLPGSNIKKDIQCFKDIFTKPEFKPDWLKIYPCLVCKNTDLYKLWKRNKYQSYSDKQLTGLLIKIKKLLPYWVRLARLFRDIPANKIEAGCKISNIRELIQKKVNCKCLRCREIKDDYDPKEKVFLCQQEYAASKGKEIFLSFENKKRTKVFAFLRLRIPDHKKHSIVRELHTYGQMLNIGEKSLSPQHRNLGKMLMKKAEQITKKKKIPRIMVISGVGAREYYRQKLDYHLENTYMVKII